MKRILTGLAILVCVLAFVLYYELRLQREDTEGPTGSSGTIEGTEVRVVAQLPARIIAMHAIEGERIERGALVAELDCAVPDAQASQARAAVATAKAHAAAARKQVATAQAQLRVTAEGVRAAEARLEAARAQATGVEARRAAAKRQAGRVATLRATGRASESDADQSQAVAKELSASKLAAKENTAAATAAVSGAIAQSDVAQAQIESVQAQVAAAEAEVARAESALELIAVQQRECRVLSPATGIVQTRVFEPGEVVGPGATLATIVRTDSLRVEFYVPNAELAAATTGRAVLLVADAVPDQTFRGVITRVSQIAEFTPRNVQTRQDRDRLVYLVEASVEDPTAALRPGMPADVRIEGTAGPTP